MAAVSVFVLMLMFLLLLLLVGVVVFDFVVLVALSKEHVGQFLREKEGNTPVEGYSERIRDGKQERSWTESSQSPSKAEQHRSQNQSKSDLSLRIFDLLSELRLFTALKMNYMSLLIRLKVMMLIMTPVINTKSRLGSHSLSSNKNP